MPEASPFRFRTEIPVRFRDLDAMGHVNNAVMFTVLETARTEYWLGVHGIPDPQGLDFVVVRAEADYKAPAHYGDVLVVACRCPEVGTKSFVLEYEVRRKKDGLLIATGRTVQACFDFHAHKTLPMTAEARARIQKFEAGGAPPERPA